jgi:hypothetical protein
MSQYDCDKESLMQRMLRVSSGNTDSMSDDTERYAVQPKSKWNKSGVNSGFEKMI